MLLAAGTSTLAEETARADVRSLADVLESAEDQRARFVLTSGKTVVGRLAKTEDGTLWIRRPSGGLLSLPLAEIAEVRIRLSAGVMVEGRLLPLADGGLGWRPADQDGPDDSKTSVTAGADPEPEAETGGPLVRVDDGFLRQDTDDAEQADSEEILSAATAPAAPDTAEPAAGPSSDPSPNDGSPPRLALAAEGQGESEGEVRFRLTLSEPAERSILIIYSTVDGSAKAPGDYQHGQGVVVFEPGQQETIVATRIVDDTVAEGDETLSIFITADPAAVVIEERKITATIIDND
jgi:hypothetical protein